MRVVPLHEDTTSVREVEIHPCGRLTYLRGSRIVILEDAISAVHTGGVAAHLLVQHARGSMAPRAGGGGAPGGVGDDWSATVTYSPEMDPPFSYWA